jgi:prepilin-type N-terminal cleavage/methylation domain-containing protein
MKNKSQSAFSLIELIVVIAVIAAISVVIVPSISGTNDAAKESAAKATAHAINNAQIQWRLTHSATTWNGFTDEKRYTELVADGGLTYAEASLSALELKIDSSHAYTFDLQNADGNGRMQRVILKKGETTIDY